MIPRFKPFFGAGELLRCALPARKGEVERFEAAFAAKLGFAGALMFPYGRVALLALFKALRLEGREVVMPAYTCSVVAHAAVLAGCKPRFVDIELSDFNMRLDKLEEAVGPETGAIVATHLFGYPLNLDALAGVVERAQARLGRKIFVIQDCAHSFGASWKGRSAALAGDAALFALNISKLMSSVFGGVMASNDQALLSRLAEARASLLKPPSVGKSLSRRLYLLACYPAFSGPGCAFMNWLLENTGLLDGMAKAYHLDEKIHFPPDAFTASCDFEAGVGMVQLGKLDRIIERRRANAAFYDKALRAAPGFIKPPLVEGATYSHYVVRVPDKRDMLRRFAARGVQLGELIEYSVPYTAPYADMRGGEEFPNSLLCSEHMINLPVHYGLEKRKMERVVETFNLYLRGKS